LVGQFCQNWQRSYPVFIILIATELNQGDSMTACSTDIASPLYFFLIPQISALANKVISGLTL
jgi:hypothetical protein